MSKRGDQRLLKLAAFLDKLPKSKFDFNTYTEGEVEGDNELSCGSVACAVGWLPNVFPRTFYWDSTYYTVDPTVALKSERGFHRNQYRVRNINATLAFFDLTSSEADYLFVPGNFASGLSGESSPKRVAKHIRAFIGGRHPELLGGTP